ncbi:hypothetical protein [Geobacter sp.]|uniref:hypothetical protein n=1 Tax=Geobacter sp. TaxID=46610 RepID=UPI0027BA3428|nr:hypothetical protein [Geobacter sp.]
MITILFISDDIRAADLIARFQPQLKARLRLALDFDQGLKEVFDNRPAAVFIQSNISGISGETVARHIKTLLRTDAPRIVLIHTSPLSMQGTKKWFDDTVDFSLPQTDLVEQFRQRLAEIAPDHWFEQNHGQSRSSEDVPVANEVDAPVPVSPPPGEFEFFDWESPGNTGTAVVHAPPIQPGTEINEFQHRVPSSGATPVPVEEGEDAVAPSLVSPGAELRAVMPSIIEETAAAQSVFSDQVPSPQVSASPPVPPPHEVAHQPAPPPRTSLSYGVAVPVEQSAASLGSFSAEKPDGGNAEWVTVPSPGKEFKEPSGQRLSLWAVVIVVLLIGAVVGGSLLLKGGGRNTGTVGKPASQTPAPARPLSASAPSAVTPAAVEIPSFVPVSGRDPGYGKAHPGWERYRGAGVEFRLYREQGRLKVVQVIALRGKTIPEAQVTKIVKVLTGSGNRTISSHTNKGGYLREVGKIAGNNEIVIYRKGSVIRGVVITLG